MISNVSNSKLADRLYGRLDWKLATANIPSNHLLIDHLIGTKCRLHQSKTQFKSVFGTHAHIPKYTLILSPRHYPWGQDKPQLNWNRTHVFSHSSLVVSRIANDDKPKTKTVTMSTFFLLSLLPSTYPVFCSLPCHLLLVRLQIFRFN